MSVREGQAKPTLIDQARTMANAREQSYITVHLPKSTNSSPQQENTSKFLGSEENKAAIDSESQPVVTRRELWSYYLYYNGNNGVAIYILTPTLLQLLATSAGYDPVHGPDSSCTADNASGDCVIPWGHGTKSVTSMILLASGIGFAVLTMTFTTICSVADYGNLNRWMLLLFTCIFCASQFAWMSLTVPSRWPLAMALYIIGFVSYGMVLTLYAAAYPRLARNTRRSKLLRQGYESGEISKEEHAAEESLEMNRISNISVLHSNIGFIISMCLCIGLLLTLKDNPLVDNYTIVLINGYYIITGMWWFVFQQPRPGLPLPKGENYCTIGWKQLWTALKEYRRLPNTFIYLTASFLLADGTNTTSTLVTILQNNEFSYSFLQNSYLGLAQAVAAVISIFAMWHIQRYFRISTKKMFMVTSVCSFLIPFWGMLGIWTDTIGFRNVGEFWAFNVIFGLFQVPYYAFSQTMMAELTPPGYENLFFGLFGMSTRISSMIGPYIVQAIVDKTGNNWMGFPFLFAICAAASILVWFGVDMQKGKRDALAWEENNETSVRASQEE